MVRLSKKQQIFIKKLIWISLVCLFVILFLTKFFRFIGPFVFAFIIMLIIERPVQFLQKKAGLPRGIAVATALLFFVVIVGGIIVLLFYKMTVELVRLAQNLSSTQSMWQYFEVLIEQSQNFYITLPQQVTQAIEENLGTIMATVSKWLTELIGFMLGIVKSLPAVFIFIAVSIVAAFFMSRDREKISRFVFKQLSPTWRSKFQSIRGDVTGGVLGYFKAQCVLMTITFLELLAGYSIMGIDYAFSFAVFTAIVDALPVLGTGTVLVPAAIISFIMGNTQRGVCFIGLYVIITVVRQFLEPRIVGERIGLHPLVTLMAMYVGLQVFGVLGLVLGPIIAIILKALHKVKIIPQWKE